MAEAGLTTNEVLLASDLDDTFRDNAYDIGIGPPNLDWESDIPASIMLAGSVVAGPEDDFEEFSNVSLALYRSRNYRVGEVTLISIIYRIGSTVEMIGLLMLASGCRLSNNLERATDDDVLLARGLLERAQWDPDLSRDVAGISLVGMSIYLANLET